MGDVRRAWVTAAPGASLSVKFDGETTGKPVTKRASQRALAGLAVNDEVLVLVEQGVIYLLDEAVSI